MLARILATTALVALLSACGETETQAADPAQPAEAAQDGAGLAAAEAQVDALKAFVMMDSENCFLPEGAEQQATAVDLGGGVGAVIVQCTQGNRDMWSRLFIVPAEGEPEHPQPVPLYQYDIQGDGQWRAEDATPNLEWLADEQVFFSGIHGPDLCGTMTRWRWDAEAHRVALVEQAVQDCDGVRDGDDLPAPRVIWPTNPPTPEPGA